MDKDMMAGTSSAPAEAPIGVPEPYLLQVIPEFDPKNLKVKAAKNPLAYSTFGDIGIAAEVKGPAEFPMTALIQPLDLGSLSGVDPYTIRVFRWDDKHRSLMPVWNSGVNVGLGFTWTKIRRPGVYVPIGLPRDRMLLEALRIMARQRRYVDPASVEENEAVTKNALSMLADGAMDEDDIEDLRNLLAAAEMQTSTNQGSDMMIDKGPHATVTNLSLKSGMSLKSFKEDVLPRLKVPPGGLPEEALFYRPEASNEQEPPWDTPRHLYLRGDLPVELPARKLNYHLPMSRSWLCWLVSNRWWMYHHDARHSGRATGCSSISSTSVGTMRQTADVVLDGDIESMPSIIRSKIYVGSGNSPGGGGTLYKVDLLTGDIEASFHFTTPALEGSGQGYAGIGASPAIVEDRESPLRLRVYVSGLDGRLYCLDGDTLVQIWVTDLRHADIAHNQPVEHGRVRAEGWCSPLVVNGRVYVGFGEGESGAFGFVYCLDWSTGRVIWLFCTNQFKEGLDNSPNVVPESVAARPLLQDFRSQADPPFKGVSVWSSCAYDRALNRIYLGTGNSTREPGSLPDALYGSGALALDADTGEFKGYFQPSPEDSYWPKDSDVDMPSSPMLYTKDGREVLAIGNKNGSFFLLDADTMKPLARRQLLPKDSNGKQLDSIDPGGKDGGENMYGIFGTAAADYWLGRIYVGVGGYMGAIDSETTPFMRALSWDDLSDSWATAPGPHGVDRYVASRPPMYTTPGEAGLSSPALVNDVVLCSTTRPGFYAFDADSGLCLWSATGLGPSGANILGPAVYGNHVVIGCGRHLLIYSV